MLNRKILFIFILNFWLCCSVKLRYGDEKLVSLTQTEGSFVLHNGVVSGWVAKANFSDTIFQDGWSYLEVETNAAYPDLSQSYAAGFVEGASSHTLIYNTWRNTAKGFCDRRGQKFCDSLRDFLNRNKEWMMKEIKSKKDSSYWHQVNLVLSQLTGLSDGYNHVALEKISFEDFLLINLSGDMLDLTNVLDPERREMSFEQWLNATWLYSDGRCSAIIKLLPGNTDLLVSHVTWNSYQSMLRVQKNYVLPFSSHGFGTDRIRGYASTFSSYPACLHSVDDFFTLSSGLVTLETTIGNSNPALWANVTPEGEVQEWIRVLVANRLAASGDEWSRIFEQYNSGTYNNQWMVVDYKLFKPGKPIRPKTLFVLEQIPGLVKYEDKSALLNSRSYWPSYNIASFPEVFNLSGGSELVHKYGNWFSYAQSPRALIFARDHDKVKDMPSLFALMRYNDYKHDPLSLCNCTPPHNAENAISARCELNPRDGIYPFAALEHKSHGGIDAKATNADLARQMRFQAISGPSYDQQPVFKWSEQDFAADTPHYGHPDAWKFPIVEHKWLWV